jgi:hypothetical protein
MTVPSVRRSGLPRQRLGLGWVGSGIPVWATTRSWLRTEAEREQGSPDWHVVSPVSIYLRTDLGIFRTESGESESSEAHTLEEAWWAGKAGIVRETRTSGAT